VAVKNKFYQILSPDENDQGVWIHQDAWFSLGEFEKGREDTYNIKKEGNGVYAMLISGEAEINGQPLKLRDGFGIWNTNELILLATEKATILLMDVPMQN